MLIVIKKIKKQKQMLRYYSLLLLVSISSNAQKQFVDNDTFCEFDNSISYSDKSFARENLSKEQIEKLNKYAQVKLRDDNDELIRLFYNPQIDTIITKMIDSKKTGIYKTLKYTRDGKLAIAYFNHILSDLLISKIYYYNKSGEVIKTEDERQIDNYPICFKEALHIVENRIQEKDSIIAINREKKHLKQKDTLYYWDVFVRQPIQDKNNKTWIYRINAKNGTLIKKTRAITVHRSY